MSKSRKQRIRERVKAVNIWTHEETMKQVKKVLRFVAEKEICAHALQVAAFVRDQDYELRFTRILNPKLWPKKVVRKNRAARKGLK
jgi:ferritin